MDCAAAPIRKTRWWFIIGTMVAGACLFVAGRICLWHAGQDPRASRLARLSPDECQKVLTECREILTKKDGWIAQYGGHLVESRWPTSVRSLKPTTVTVGDDFVELWYCRGKVGFGLLAYAEGAKPSGRRPDPGLHLLEVTPGLWLFEDADGDEALKWEK